MAVLAEVEQFALNTGTGSQNVSLSTFGGATPTGAILIGSGTTSNAHSNADAEFGIGYAAGAVNLSTFSRASNGVSTTDCDRLGDNMSIAEYIDFDRVVTESVSLSSFSANTVGLNIDTAGSARLVGMLALGGDVSAAVINANSVDSTTGNIAYTGAGFQPKAVILSSCGATSGSSFDHFFLSMGVATAQAGFSVSGQSQTAVTTTNDFTLTDDGLVICHFINTAQSINTSASLSSLDADGFTLNYDASGSSTRRCWALCLGGDAEYRCGSFSQPGETGSQVVSVPGFIPVAVMFFMGGGSVADAFVDDLCMSCGFSDGTASAVSACYGLNGAATSSCGKYSSSSSAIAAISDSAVVAEASLTNLAEGHFTVEWSTADAGARDVVYLAIGLSASGGSGGLLLPF